MLRPALSLLALLRSSSIASSCARATCRRAVLAAVLAAFTLKPPPPRSPEITIPLVISRPPCDPARTAVGGRPSMALPIFASPSSPSLIPVSVGALGDREKQTRVVEVSRGMLYLVAQVRGGRRL